MIALFANTPFSVLVVASTSGASSFTSSTSLAAPGRQLEVDLDIGAQPRPVRARVRPCGSWELRWRSNKSQVRCRGNVLSRTICAKQSFYLRAAILDGNLGPDDNRSAGIGDLSRDAPLRLAHQDRLRTNDTRTTMNAAIRRIVFIRAPSTFRRCCILEQEVWTGDNGSTGGKSQASFEFACVDQKTRLLERLRARTEAAAMPVHGELQGSVSRTKSLKEHRQSQRKWREFLVLSSLFLNRWHGPRACSQFFPSRPRAHMLSRRRPSTS